MPGVRARVEQKSILVFSLLISIIVCAFLLSATTKLQKCTNLSDIMRGVHDLMVQGAWLRINISFVTYFILVAKARQEN